LVQLPTLAVNREKATNRHFDLIAIEVIIHARQRQIKSDRRCSHLQANGEIGICLATKDRGLAAWLAVNLSPSAQFTYENPKVK
jgi:hypothetical protein